MQQAAPLPQVEREYQYGREAYAALGASSALRVGLRKELEPLISAFPELR